MTLCQLFLCFCIRYLHSAFLLSLFFCSVKLTFIHKCLHMFNCTLCEFLLKSQRFFKCMALLQPDINICIEYGCEIYSVNICTIVAAYKTKKKNKHKLANICILLRRQMHFHSNYTTVSWFLGAVPWNRNAWKTPKGVKDYNYL